MTSTLTETVDGTEAQHADAFVCFLVEDQVEAMVVAVVEHRSALVESLKMPDEYLVMLERHHTETVAALRRSIGEL